MKRLLLLLSFLSLVFVVGCNTTITTTLSTESSTSATTSSPNTTQTTTTQITTTTAPITTLTTTTKEENQLNLLDGTPLQTENAIPASSYVPYTQNYDAGALLIQPSKFHKQDRLIKDVSALDLSPYKKLVITAKGDGLMMLKLSSTIFIEPGKDIMMVPLSMFETTFEFHLDFENYHLVRDTLQTIQLTFGADVNESSSDLNLVPPKHAFTTPIVITAFYFTDAEPIEDLTFNVKGIVTDPNSIIDLEPIDLMDGWEINEAETYTIQRTPDSLIISTTLSKPVWGYIYLTLEGYLKNYTVISITVSGTPGKAFKMKLEGPNISVIETGSTTNGNILDPILTQSPTTYTWTFTPANMTAGEAIRLLIFFEPGAVGSGATMTITNFELKTPVS